MKEYLLLIGVLISFSLGYQAIADEVKQKTDDSFVGFASPQAINSSFVGDITNSMVNESLGKDGFQNKTDGIFVGEGTIATPNNFFAGDDYRDMVRNGTNAPFAGEKPVDDNSYGK